MGSDIEPRKAHEPVSPEKVLVVLAGVFAALSVVGIMVSIWAGDSRWGATGGVLAAVAFISGFLSWSIWMTRGERW